jgi:hypothetical protein
MLGIRRSDRLAGRGTGLTSAIRDVARSRKRGLRPMGTIARRTCLLGGLSAAVVLASGGSALAVSGTPIHIGEPFASEHVSVAVDSTGTAYIAWANTRDLPPTTTNVVEYCVLPAGAKACLYTAKLAPADNGVAIDNVQVLVDESTVVILADVYGTSGSHGGEYVPEQEWQSTDGGAAFGIVDEGKSVASGILSAITEPLSAVIVPGADALGYGWNTAGGEPPTFDEFPLTDPPQCSVEEGKCPENEKFATLEPNTNPDQISNAGGQFASQLSANPGVLAIFNTGFSNGPLACLPGSGTAYAYGSGAQSATNSYDISPGLPDSAWRVAVAQADCNVEDPAVAGGPSGFGVLEQNTATNDIVYHTFDQAKENFDTPQVTIAANASELYPSVSQDGAGGVYATFLLGGGGGQISLAYSSNGGATWTGPATLYPDADLGANELKSSVGPTGQGWAAWFDNGSVYAQQFVASDAIPPPSPATATTLTTTQTAAGATGASLTVPAGTIGETDRATLAGTNAASATGTVTYGLYSSSGCTSSGEVFHGGTAAVAGGVAAPSAPVTTALAPGDYYWQAAYSGDSKNLASTSACGAEVLTVVPAVVIEGSGSSSGGAVTITVSCPSSEPCSVTVTITGTEVTIVFKASAARKKRVKLTKTVTIASGKFTIPGKESKKLTLHLTKAGKRLLGRNHGHLKAKVLVSDKTPAGAELTTRTISITAVKKHKHKK